MSKAIRWVLREPKSAHSVTVFPNINHSPLQLRQMVLRALGLTGKDASKLILVDASGFDVIVDKSLPPGIYTVTFAETPDERESEDAEAEEVEEEDNSADYKEQADGQKSPQDLEVLAVDFKGRQRDRRKAVSAESDPVDEKWEKKVVPKTEDQLARINKAVASSFLFALLKHEQKKDIIDCMQEIKAEAGTNVITQNGDGDFFYVVDSGEYEVLIQDTPTSPPKKVFQYHDSGSFGELALMYGHPRSATIRAVTDGVLWGVDRATFRGVVVASQAQERARREGFLKKVPLLATMTPSERALIADILVDKEFRAGEYVIRQGESGNTFYIIESGEAVATQANPHADNGEEVIRKLTAGEYFGERALITQQERSANIKAISDLKVGAMERSAFERLFGKLKELMTGQMESYI